MSQNIETATATESKSATEEKPVEVKAEEETNEEETDKKETEESSSEPQDEKDETTKNEETEDEDEEEKKKAEEEEKKRIEELKKKYASWPLRGIKDPHENDVMYGRGGGTNHHPGNKRYRKMVEDRKLEYVNSKRLDKPLVALEIIRLWRAQLPPGRFLKLDEKTGLWNDVGDKKAREKTSQALREKAPLIRKQQEDEQRGSDDDAGEKKTTRFADGTKDDSKKTRKPVLARDHSLGREYLGAGESVSLEGFTWQDPFQSNSRTSSYGSATSPSAQAYSPSGRISSQGSMGIAPPHHGGPPPPPDYYGRVGDERTRHFSNGRYDSWGATGMNGSPYAYAPPGATHQRSGSWTNPPVPPPHVPGHQRSGSWNGREHSLSYNPLIGASVARPADRRTFEHRPSSGYWGEGPYGPAGPYRSPQRHTSPTNNTPSPNSPYSVDMDIARTWSGGEGGRTWSAGQPQPQHNDGYPKPVPGNDISPQRTSGALPRPQMVKRDTSHQNENVETKPSVKRAALNRDNSLASNLLKQQYMPEFYNNKSFDSDTEVKILSDNLEQSTLNSAAKAKPVPLTQQGRTSTLDAISADLMAKPEPLLEGNRVSTIDALGIDLELPFEKEFSTDLKDLPKPSAMNSDNRLTTNEFLAIVNDEAPLPLDKEKDNGQLPFREMVGSIIE